MFLEMGRRMPWWELEVDMDADYNTSCCIKQEVINDTLSISRDLFAVIDGPCNGLCD